MKTRFSLSFLLKRFKELPNGTAPIYLRIPIDEERVELSTKKYILPDKYSPNKFYSSHSKIRSSLKG